MNIDSLNEAQRLAVTQPLASSLVLAGAGSGKTCVLTQRIAWLIQNERISLGSILAVTFTNKAAAEIRDRLGTLLQVSVNRMWVGTFHSIAHKLLRMHAKSAGLPENFQIIDSDDQLRLIKRLMKSENINNETCSPRAVQGYINRKKEEGIRAERIEEEIFFDKKMMRQIYIIYEKQCQHLGVVDFAELLLRAYELWLNCPAVLAQYHERFRFILIDEFQDTNKLQYSWIRKLAGDDNFVMAVGDDDQSIYGWRGACIENIKQFTTDFPGASIVRLEQNYRSTRTILQAANAVIECNQDRLGKTLWTNSDEGNPVGLFEALSETDEAQFIAETIDKEYKTGKQYCDFAILYRSNAQSRVLEEALIQSGIPYHVYGGQRFFERAEIKNALAYLRLIYQPGDDAAFERIINVPPRGIGDKTLQTIRDTANTNRLTMWGAVEILLSTNALMARATTALIQFVELITQWQKMATSDTFKLEVLTDNVINKSGLVPFYQQDKGEKGRNRIENLKELVNACKQFEPAEYEADQHFLEAFLIYSTLDGGSRQKKEDKDCVQMMTIHSAKGLEFTVVFICGMEEGLFPNQFSLNEDNLNEERRLCYVGITRAKEKLYLTCAGVRYFYGDSRKQEPSRFISEIPQNLISHVYSKKQRFGRPVTASRSKTVTAVCKSADISKSSHGLKVGQRVQHQHFGEGSVISIENREQDEAVAQIRFNQGTKRLMLKHAKLIPL